MMQAIPTNSDPHGDQYRKNNRFTPEKKALEKQAALEIIQREFPDIYSPSENKVVSNEQVNALFEQVCDGEPGQEKRIRHNTLVKFLIDRARDYSWTVNVPAYALLEQGEKAIAHPESFAKLPRYRALVSIFNQSLEQSSTTKEHDRTKLWRYEAGQLIFSMISQGGLHHHQWLQAATDSVQSGINGYERLNWVNLQVGAQLRRWFPDPISGLLIQRWFRRWGLRWPIAKSEQLLKEFFEAETGQQRTAPESLKFILSAAAMDPDINPSGFIRHYQTTQNASVSLPEAAWWRLQTKAVPQREKFAFQAPRLLSQITPVVDASELLGGCSEDGLVTLRSVQKALSSTQGHKKRSRKMIAESLAEVAANEKQAPIVRVLSLWCQQMITSRREGGGNTLRVSSVRTYLSRIGPPLVVALAGVRNLNELGEDDWEYVYEDLINRSKSPSHQLNRAIQARDFHQFLVDHFALPEAYIERADGGERVVDADILTPAEFVRAKLLLQTHSKDPRMARIRSLVLMLGFRCGLRRGEVQKIQLRDLPGVSEPALDKPELKIRPSTFGSVKTNASIRKLPLSVLLTAEELRDLRYWTQQRRMEQTVPRPMELLFCERHQSSRVLSSLELFKPIQEAMQIASGAKLRFHHLRHAFATFTGLRLLEPTTGALMLKEWAEDDEGNVVMPHWGEDYPAISELASANSATGKRLWLLGQWCGHATPSETLKSYSHLVDWVGFHERLAGNNRPLSSSQQAYLLDVSMKSLSVFRARHGLKGLTRAYQLLCVATNRWPASFRRTKPAGLKCYQSPMAPDQSLEEAVKPQISAMQVYNIFQKMGALQARGKSETDAISEAAAYYSQAQEQVEQWHRRAIRMMNDPTDKKALINQTVESERGPAPGSIYRRWSARYQSELPRPFTEKMRNQSATRPELIQSPAPPTPHIAQEYCEKIFEKLVYWSDSEPQAFSVAMNAIQNAMQRSHQQISFRSDENKKRYRQLLKQAELCHLVKVHVKPPPNSVYKKGALKQYWTTELEVSHARVRLLSEHAKGERNALGVAQIEISPDVSLGDAARLMTMSTIRFSIFMVAVVFEGELAIDQKSGCSGIVNLANTGAVSI